MTEQASLFERLGGAPAIEAFAEIAVRRCMLDDTIGHIWNHLTEDAVQHEINGFIDWMHEYWGGTLKYTGPDMATVHRGMGITDEYWDALFVIIDQLYEEFGIAPDLRVEVNTFLKAFKPAIVGSPTLRETVKAHPDMNILQGMKSVGVNWPGAPVATPVGVIA